MQQAIRIYETDDYLQMAEKIYFHFEVNQSCTIKGFVTDRETVTPKGEMVLNQLTKLDAAANIDKCNRRKRVKPPNSIGDFVAGKIFKWEQRVQDKKIIYLIWRMQ